VELFISWTDICSSRTSYPLERIGCKAVGLLEVPSRWTPPYFIIIDKLHRLLTASHSSGHDIDLLEETSLSKLLTESELQVLQTCLHEIQDSVHNEVSVRSSHSYEDMTNRGFFESVSPISLDVESVLNACLKVYQSANNTDGTMSVIVQRYIHYPNLTGHLSNELRVKKHKYQWLIETQSLNNEPSIVDSIDSRSSKPADEASSIICQNRTELEKAIRRVAAWGQKQDERLHFEWIWDRHNLWVLQADKVPPPSHGKVPKKVQITPTLPTDTNFAKLRYGTSDSDRWHKINCSNIFRAAGAPQVPLWLLDDKEELRLLELGQVSAELRQDLAQLCQQPVTIRTDCPPGGISELNLPRSDTLSGVEEVLKWLLETSGALRILDKDYCFILHNFVSSSASAWSLASFAHDAIHIDSLWGLADGISYMPHDTFICAPNSEVQKRIRYKPAFLDVDSATGKWTTYNLQANWSWKATLSDTEARTIATQSKQIAVSLGKNVLIMWFLGVTLSSGEIVCLPWFIQDSDGTYTQDLTPTQSIVSNKRHVITTMDNIEDFARRTDQCTTILLRPSADLIRSEEFIQRIAELTNGKKIRVELEGSVLAHAYYCLQRAGVQVICVDLFSYTPAVLEFNKLVRDKIPEKIRSKGEAVSAVKISGALLETHIRRKILEEAVEVYHAIGKENLAEEIADLFEILMSLIRRTGLDVAYIRSIGRAKTEKLGAFEDGIQLMRTSSSSPLRVLEPGIGPSQDSIKFPPTGSEPIIGPDVQETPTYANSYISIPIVPPIQNGAILHRGYELECGDIRVVISYDKLHVILRLDKASESKTSINPNQLEIPF